MVKFKKTLLYFFIFSLLLCLNLNQLIATDEGSGGRAGVKALLESKTFINDMNVWRDAGNGSGKLDKDYISFIESRLGAKALETADKKAIENAAKIKGTSNLLAIHKKISKALIASLSKKSAMPSTLAVRQEEASKKLGENKTDEDVTGCTVCDMQKKIRSNERIAGKEVSGQVGEQSEQGAETVGR
ncbi:MAG: hypothetical protein HQK51_14740 [Oligoflexia bacterium]|nr:hypothetical protein [Oligoflexia bacterium]